MMDVKYVLQMIYKIDSFDKLNVNCFWYGIYGSRMSLFLNIDKLANKNCVCVSWTFD